MNFVRLNDGHALARVLEQPEPVRAAIAKVLRTNGLTDVTVVTVGIGDSCHQGEGMHHSIVLLGYMFGQRIGIVLNFSETDLQIAADPRDDFGGIAIGSQMPEPIQSIARELFAAKYRLKNEYDSAGSGHVGFVLGRGHEGSDPRGLSIGLDWGAWLAGYPTGQ